MGYLFIKGYIYFINIFVFGGLLSYWGILFCGYMVGIIFFGFGVFLGFFGLWDWEFLDFVEESYI